MDATAVGTRNASDGVNLRSHEPEAYLDLILDALKSAVADPREHRLFE